MKAQRDTATHMFDVEHVGVDLDFYHPKGRDLLPAHDVVRAFERDRENAEIFIQNASGTGFSCDEILDWFLLQTQSTLADHLPPGALEGADGKVMLTIPIRFEPDTFHMKTDAGNVDLSALKLMCKVVAAPRAQVRNG